MKTFHDALKDGVWDTDEFGPVLTLVGPKDGQYYEVRLESLLFGQYYLAVYLGDENDPYMRLIGEKVPVRPGGHSEAIDD